MVFLTNEVLFVATDGHWGGLYIPVRVILIPLVCVVVVVATVVRLFAVQPLGERLRLLTALAFPVGIFLFQYLYGTSLLLDLLDGG